MIRATCAEDRLYLRSGLDGRQRCEVEGSARGVAGWPARCNCHWAGRHRTGFGWDQSGMAHAKGGGFDARFEMPEDLPPAPSARVLSFCCTPPLPLVGVSVAMERERQ